MNETHSRKDVNFTLTGMKMVLYSSLYIADQVMHDIKITACYSVPYSTKHKVSFQRPSLIQ